MRSFSKIHGLAALRCGWAYGHADIVAALHKVGGAFNVSALAQAAAKAALLDLPHEQRARVHNTRERVWLAAQLKASGIDVVPSVGKFLMLRFEADTACAGALGALQEQGVSVLPLVRYGLPQAIRATIGTREQNEAVVAALCGDTA